MGGGPWKFCGSFSFPQTEIVWGLKHVISIPDVSLRMLSCLSTEAGLHLVVTSS